MPQPPVLHVRGVIGQDFLLEHTESFLADIPEAGHIKLAISSPGGDVGVGADVYDRLVAFRKAGGTVEVVVEDLAASMGTIIAMAASPGLLSAASPFTQWMVHKPLFPMMLDVNADDLRYLAEQLDEIERPFVHIYSERTGKSPEEIQELMRKEMVMSAQTAQEWGFIDQILAPEESEGETQHVKAVAFYNPSKPTIEHKQMTEKDEQSLLAKVGAFFGLTPKAEAETPQPEEQPKVQGASTSTEQGTLYYEGETLEVGTLVFSDEALSTPAETGEYVSEAGTILVTEGQVTEIQPKEEEQPAPAEEPAALVTQDVLAQVKALKDEVVALRSKLEVKASNDVPGAGNPSTPAPQNFSNDTAEAEPFAESAKNIVSKYNRRR